MAIYEKDDISIRRATVDDYDFILKLNKDNVEVLSPMDLNKLEIFVREAELLWVICINDKRVGFLIALRENAPTYDSENYLWFKKHYNSFLYIDRIVIDNNAHSKGLGRILYNNVFKYVQDNSIPLVTAEIDTVPYNEASLKFHKAMGFKEVGKQSVRGGNVEVSLQTAEVK